MFSIRLKNLRAEKDLTQKQLAEILHMQNTAISKYELGERKPDQEILIKLAEYFNTTTDYLLGNSDIRNPYNDVIKSDDTDPLDIYLDELKKEAVKRNINFDTTSPSDLLDFLEFIQKTKGKKQ